MPHRIPSLLRAALACSTAAGLLAAAPSFAGERPAKGGPIKPEVLYHNYCSVCHGDKGDGNSRAKGSLVPPPQDFTTAKHLTKEYVAKIVADGKPGTAMVPWKSQLNEAEIAAVADYVMATFVHKTNKAPDPKDLQGISGTHAHGGKGTENAPAAAAAPAKVDMSLAFPNGLKGDAGKGEAFYMNNCATCHGKKGDGQGPRAYFINPKPRNFKDPATSGMLNRPAIFAATQWGKNGTDMPAWKHVMSDQEIANVSEFVFRRFVQPNAAKTAKAGK